MSNTEQAPALKPDGLDKLGYEILIEKTRLYDDLCSIANNNDGFKKGRLDSVTFEITEGDAREVAQYDEYQDDEDNPLGLVKSMLRSYVEVGYRFEARRQRIAEAGEQDVSMSFTFSIFGRHFGVELPPTIAEAELGVTAEDAVMKVGLVTEEKSQYFNFDSSHFALMLCERMSYLDDDDNIISEVCNCAGNHEEVYYYPKRWEDYDDDDDDVDDEVMVGGRDETNISQYQAVHLVEKSQNEPITYSEGDEGIEVALADLVDMERMREEISIYDTERKVQAAHAVLQSIRAALLRQAGVEPEA